MTRYIKSQNPNRSLTVHPEATYVTQPQLLDSEGLFDDGTNPLDPSVSAKVTGVTSAEPLKRTAAGAK
jgi:hypothetical protein